VARALGVPVGKCHVQLIGPHRKPTVFLRCSVASLPAGAVGRAALVLGSAADAWSVWQVRGEPHPGDFGGWEWWDPLIEGGRSERVRPGAAPV
jgi:hypothetical protein